MLDIAALHCRWTHGQERLRSELFAGIVWQPGPPARPPVGGLMPRQAEKTFDLDSAGVYFISVEEFEARSGKADDEKDDTKGEEAADTDIRDARELEQPKRK